MANTIFLSYRRKDSQLTCDRIHASLSEVYGPGQVFRDINTIATGLDFRAVVEQALRSAKVLLVLIGPHWLTITDDAGNRRLDDPNDQVRQEIEQALRKNLIILPILVQHATMPLERDLPPSIGPLAYRNAREVRPDPDYLRDMRAVIQDLAGYLPAPSGTPPIRSAIRLSRRVIGSLTSLAILVLTMLSLATWINIPLLSDLVKRILGH